MWRLIRSTASVTCTEAVPVQESMWNFMSTTTTTTTTQPQTKGLVLIIIIRIIKIVIMVLQQLCQALTSLEDPLFFHTILPLFLNPCRLIFLQIRSPGLYQKTKKEFLFLVVSEIDVNRFFISLLVVFCFCFLYCL